MYPDHLRYSKEHEWVTLEGEVRTVGITHHAQEELGDIVYVELPDAGAEFDANRPFGTVESVKAVSELFCPVGGEIVEVNDELRDHPEIINQDPYGKGWIVKLRIRDASEAEKLLSAEGYQAYLSEKKD